MMKTQSGSYIFLINAKILHQRSRMTVRVFWKVWIVLKMNSANLIGPRTWIYYGGNSKRIWKWITRAVQWNYIFIIQTMLLELWEILQAVTTTYRKQQYSEVSHSFVGSASIDSFFRSNKIYYYVISLPGDFTGKIIQIATQSNWWCSGTNPRLTLQRMIIASPFRAPLNSFLIWKSF